MENMQELEQMRSQMNALKQKLDTQEIVSDRLLRETFRQKMSFGQQRGKIALFVALPFTVILFTTAHYSMGMSWMLTIFTIVMVAVGAINEYRLTIMGARNLFDNNMLSATLQRAERNRQIKISVMIALPILTIWIAWIIAEILTNMVPIGIDTSTGTLQDYRYGMIVGLSIGAGIGVIIGFITYMRISRNSQNIIDQINDISNA